MSGKPNWGAALQALGAGLGDIAQHQREEKLMKLVREQKVADIEAERKYQDDLWKSRNPEMTIPAGAETWGLGAPGGMAGAELPSGPQSTMEPFTTRDPSLYRYMMEDIDPLNRRAQEAQIAASEALAADRMRPPTPARDPVADANAIWDHRGANPHPSENTPKTPDMAGLYAAVKGFDPNLSAAYENAGLLDDVNAAAVRAAQSGLQPEAAVPQAYQQFAPDPSLVNELSGALPSGLAVGGLMPPQQTWKNAGPLKDNEERSYLESFLAANEEARKKIQAVGAKTKTITVEKVDAIIAGVAAKWKLDADGQNALREQIYIGRAAEGMGGGTGSGGTSETAAQRRARELAGGGA